MEIIQERKQILIEEGTSGTKGAAGRDLLALPIQLNVHGIFLVLMCHVARSGGEFSSLYQSSFHHYRDLWCFDIPTQSWDRIETKVRPTVRSGHRYVICRGRDIPLL